MKFDIEAVAVLAAIFALFAAIVAGTGCVVHREQYAQWKLDREICMELSRQQATDPGLCMSDFGWVQRKW